MEPKIAGLRCHAPRFSCLENILPQFSQKRWKQGLIDSRAFEIPLDLREPLRKTRLFHVVVGFDMGLDIDQGAAVHDLQALGLEDAALPRQQGQRSRQGC